MINGIKFLKVNPYFLKIFARSYVLVMVKKSTGLDCPDVTAERNRGRF